MLSHRISNTGNIIVAKYRQGGYPDITLLRCDHSIIGAVVDADRQNSPYYIFHYPEFFKYIVRKNRTDRPRILNM